jgi:cobalamin biosynthesis Mg chelatase CobN
VSTAPSTTTHTDALETTLVAGVGDACTNCGARLAAEQRYCVECGERRGQARLPFADAVEQRTQAAAAAATPPKKHRGLTANGALIAGVGTLILALGVGVLIGRSGNNSSGKAAAAPQVIHVDSGSATGATGAGAVAAAGAAGGSKAAKKKAAKGGGGGKKSALSKQTVQQKGSSTPPAAVKVGSPGHGKGYKNGKFTGDFFGQ